MVKVSFLKKYFKQWLNFINLNIKPGVKKSNSSGEDGIPYEYGRRKKKSAQQGRKYRKWLVRIIMISICAGVGVKIFNSDFIQSLLSEVWEKIKELREPTPELVENAETTTSHTEIMARAKKALVIIGLVALILISIQSTSRKIESQSLVDGSKEINRDEGLCEKSLESKSQAFRLTVGIWIQWGTWIANILSSYSVFWCSCYTHLKKIIPYVTWCQKKYMTFARPGCDEYCSHLIDCILSGRAIQMLSPYFTIWAGTYYNPLLGVFSLIN